MFADLCQSYLGVHDHPLMPEVMRYISELGINISPAEAAGILDADRKEPDRALTRAIEHMKKLQNRQQRRQQQQQQPQSQQREKPRQQQEQKRSYPQHLQELDLEALEYADTHADGPQASDVESDK